MPRVPRAWQDWHMFFTVSTQAVCDFIVGAMPLPLSPVPGNSFLAGMVSSEYQ